MPRYILQKNIEPVGYEGLSYGYFDRNTRKTEFLDKERFALLLKCNGKTAFNFTLLSPKQKEFLEKLQKEGAIRETKEGETREVFREYRLYPTRYRENAQWSVTGGCNYRCKHCFMSAPDCTFRHISTEKCLEICRQLGGCGIKNVSLTGGEPLIRKDFLQIVDGLLANDVMPTAILTNGGLLTEELLDALISRGVRPSFQLSYDGTGWHDWLRGVEGAEEKLLRAFEMLKVRKLSFSCAMTLHKHNVHTIRATVLKIAEYGGTSLKINVASPEGEWKKQQENALTIEESYQAYLDYLPQYMADGMPIGISLNGAFTHVKDGNAYAIADKGEDGFTPKLPICGAMRTSIYISPTGECYPCQPMMDTGNKNFPNLFITPLQEILADSHYQRCSTCSVKTFAEHNSECAACAYFKRCRGGCRATGYTQDRSNYYHRDENTCLYFRNGWSEKFKPFIDTINQKVRAED